MKRIYQNTVKAGLFGAAVLLGFSACTDDHFDVQSSSISGANTIWQNIEANSELDSVAMILRRSKVMKSETDNGQKQSYAELLNTPQQLTAWLPKNGTFNAKQYLDQLDSAQAYRARGLENAALQMEYNVSNAFARNHVARFNYEASSGDQRVRMMNGKLVTYNSSKKAFNGLSLDNDFTNVLSSNGMLHVIDGASPFAYNVYELLQTNSSFADLYKDVDAYNVYSFNSGSSTSGSMNQNGSMEYIDSVFDRTNTLMDEAKLDEINNEDSLYISVMPTGEAYAEAKSNVAQLFKFASSYNYGWDADKRDWQNKGVNALKFNTDSLKQYNAVEQILAASTFSAGLISNPAVNKSNPETFLNYALTADSLISTSKITVYNKESGEINPIFDGQTAADAIKASNGYVFAVNNYNFDPSYSFVKRTEISANQTAQVTGSTSEKGSYVNLDNDNLNDEVDLSALGGETNYYYFPVSGNSQLNIDIKLTGVLSTKYKISVVMLPNRVNVNNIRTETDGTIIEESPVFTAQVRDDKGTAIGKSVTNVKVAQDKVEKIVLWDEFTFPYAYAGLPSGYESFPVLRLSMSYAQQRTGKSKALSIAKVILEPVR